jgi:hypothetical protein
VRCPPAASSYCPPRTCPSGDIDGAVEWGVKAISTDRKSLPSLLMVARDLTKAINQTNPDALQGIEYAERLHDL